MAGITLTSVEKTYDNGFKAVKGIDLAIRDREFMVLVGPSGCGKTTTLRMIAGLEQATAGTIRIGERVVNQVEPKDRDIAMVFQSYALYPHMTVRENLGYALKLRKRPAAEIDAAVKAASAMLGLDSNLDKLPKHLSGGQRQRVAVGRAIVRKPAAFLFDEPLSNLDAKLRGEMRVEIRLLQQRLATTAVYVTHDQVEAMTLGDRITVMNAGSIQQVAPPMEVYDHPLSLIHI
jgi:ABC-type sugar transport system ATPase subunit